MLEAGGDRFGVGRVSIRTGMAGACGKDRLWRQGAKTVRSPADAGSAPAVAGDSSSPLVVAPSIAVLVSVALSVTSGARYGGMAKAKGMSVRSDNG